MKLTKQMVDEFHAIGRRVHNLQKLAFSNFPESRNMVLDLYTQELTNYKVNLEQMFENTDNKGWLLLNFIQNRLCGLIKQI